MEVELRKLSKHFGQLKANDEISFTFKPGKIYAILGENGAGKSTLMKTLSGYQTPTLGDIVIDAKVAHLNTPNDAIGHGIGMLYQDPLDFAPLTALENFISGRAKGLFLGRDKALADFKRVCENLKFDLNPHALIAAMTVGERQQLEIVRLISLGVRFLILDEPTTGISAEQKADLFNTLKRLAHEEEMTVVLVSHKLEDVEELCDELIVLRKGRLVGYEVLPCPTTRMVELMFGKFIEKPQPEHFELGKPALEIERLPIHARLFSIPDINLTVNEGEVIGLAGLDGSGQVEFMREIAGLNRPTWADHVGSLGAMFGIWIVLILLLDDVATVIWLGVITTAILVLGPLSILLWQLFRRQQEAETVPLTKLNGQMIGWRGYRDLLSRGLAYLPSGRLEEGLVGGLTITEHTGLVRDRGKPFVNWLGAWRKTQEGIQQFNIKGRPLDGVETLSGGNQQRVASFLLPEKLKLLLLENPMRGLDVESAQHIWRLLLARRTEGTSIIFSSPDLDEIMTYSDRILVFSSGRVTLVDDLADMTTARLGELIGGKA